MPDSLATDERNHAFTICPFFGAPASMGMVGVARKRGRISHYEKKFYVLFLCLVIAVFAAAQQVQAALGESVDSVASDRKALSAVQRATTTSNGYTVHEFASDAITVREYVSPSGIVFGIAWNGLTYPDLTPLLGSYASENQNALQQTPRNPGVRRRSVVQADRVIVEKWGHMRDLRGRAYAPALIPPGVSIDEIR